MAIPEYNCRASFVLLTESSKIGRVTEKYENLPCERAAEFLRGLDQALIGGKFASPYFSHIVTNLRLWDGSHDDRMEFSYMHSSAMKAASLMELYVNCSKDYKCWLADALPKSI